MNFLPEAILLYSFVFEQTAFKYIFVICVNANVCTLERIHEKSNRLCVLRSLHGFLGQSFVY